jgi:hypothetical protein
MINREKPANDQLMANLTAALSDLPSDLERRRIENDALTRHGATTNYFQEKSRGIVQPSDVRLKRDGDRLVVQWNTAYAGPEPLRWYRVMAGNRDLLKVPFRPQLTDAPLSAVVLASDVGDSAVTVVASPDAA